MSTNVTLKFLFLGLWPMLPHVREFLTVESLMCQFNDVNQRRLVVAPFLRIRLPLPALRNQNISETNLN